MSGTRTSEEAHTLRTVFLPISTDIELADAARHEGRGKQDLIREAIDRYLANRHEPRQPAGS
jgi:predicted DNA-binding protein